MPVTIETATMGRAARPDERARGSRASGATNRRGDHSESMVAPRILRFLTMLAILLMPLGMMGAAPASAMGHRASMAMPAGHCADMPQKDKKAPASPCCDCMVGCAAIPSRATCIEHEALAPMAALAASLNPAIHGLHPEAATPPPR